MAMLAAEAEVDCNQMKFLVVITGEALSLESCRLQDVHPSVGLVSSWLSSLCVIFGVYGPVLSERPPPDRL